MSSNKEAFLIKIVETYSAKRKEIQGNYWFTFKSWMKRVFNWKNEYSLLLSKEPEFLSLYKKWLIEDYFQLHNMEASDLAGVSVYLKSFKDRLTHRSHFLVAIAAIVALTSSLSAILHDPVWLYANIVTVVFIILERHSLNEQMALIQELLHIFEHAMDNANK